MKYIYLEYNNPASFITSGQKFTIVIKLDAGNDVGLGNIIIQGTLYLWKAPRCFAITCVVCGMKDNKKDVVNIVFKLHSKRNNC